MGKVTLLTVLLVLNVSSDEIEIGKGIINGKNLGLEEILKLARQNDDVLIEGRALHEFLEEYLEQDVQSQKGEIVTLGATVPVVPSVSFSFDIPEPGEFQARCIEGTCDRCLPRNRLEGPSEAEKLHPDYREWDRY